MEDRILIKSEINKSVKTFLKLAPIILLGISVFIAILLAIPKQETHYSYYWGTETRIIVGWDHLFDFDYHPHFFIYFILMCLCFVASIVIGIIYLAVRNCELTITEKNVKGKTLFGKEVVLPMYMVSAYTTRKFLSTIAVATSSGITKFLLIGNYVEIGEVLAKLINERQDNTSNSTKEPVAQSSSMDDLLKLKNLLEQGIITQEEFDAKKKQLLGL